MSCHTLRHGSLVSWKSGEEPPGRGRPLQPRSAKTPPKRWSPRPVLLGTRTVAGATEPASTRQGPPGAPTMDTPPVFVGIDVAKSHLDVASRPEGATWQVPNDEAGIPPLVAQLQEQAPTLIVLEATGGLEAPVAAALATAGLAVAVVNPRQVRAFAKAVGQLAKTDVLDAQLLAHFAEVVR